jgi:hypothetical protein
MKPEIKTIAENFSVQAPGSKRIGIGTIEINEAGECYYIWTNGFRVAVSNQDELLQAIHEELDSKNDFNDFNVGLVAIIGGLIFWGLFSLICEPIPSVALGMIGAGFLVAVFLEFLRVLEIKEKKKTAEIVFQIEKSSSVCR